MDMVTLAEEWWADGSGNPVPAGDPRGRSVLYGIGARVPASVAEALKATTESLKAIAAPVEDKAIKQSPRRKAL